jgi:transcriptional regulator with XRE-family HTH domain
MPKPVQRLLPLGRVVRQHREAQGLSQEELAVRAKIKNAKQISNLELGKNVQVKFYQDCAIGLGFRDAFDMFLQGVDPSMRRLMRLWPLLLPEHHANLVAQAKMWIVEAE